jgi:hypothetical protein
MRRPKQDMLGLKMSRRTNAAKMTRIAVVPNVIARPPASRPYGDRDVVFYADRTAAGSLVAFGLFLEDRDLGFFFLFPEVETEEKHRAQRQHSEQEFEEAFHRNLPSLIVLKRGKKSTPESSLPRICFFALPSL